MRWLLLFGTVLAAAQTFRPASQGPYFVALGDLNKDGFPDAMLPCRGELLLPSEKRPANDQLTVYLTSGSPEPRVRKDFPVGFGPYTVLASDLDGDSYQDVVVVNFQANDERHLSILWGTGSQDLLSPAEHIHVNGGGPYAKNFTQKGQPTYPTPGLTSIATVDVDPDGRTDLVAVAWSSDFFVVLRNDGKRRFSQTRFPLLPGPRDVVVADFSKDGIPDLAFTIYSSNLVEVWTGDGHGVFRQWRVFHSQGMIPYHLKAGDLNRDGRPDLAIGNRGPSDNVAIFFNEENQFRFGGSYRPGTEKKGETTADEIRDVLLYDEDGDGLLDLAATCQLSHKLVRWRGSGSSEFGQAFHSRQVDVFPGKGPRSLAALKSGLAVAFFDSNEFAVISNRR